MNIQNNTLDEEFLESQLTNKYSPPNRWRLKSFLYAGRGMIYFFINEFNARIHFFAAFLVVVFSFIYPVNRTEVMLLIFSVSLVWISEMINTAIEKAMDFISLEKYEPIRIVKDVAAGAVLIASCAALLVGAIIFIPKIFHI
jgi:diacylglycerol kinase (ATP)